MKRITACMLLVASLFLLISCGGGAEKSAAAEETVTQEAAKETAPAPSGPIIIGSNSAPRTLNPLFFPSRQDSIVTNLIFDNFVQPDKEGIIEGALAKSFEISEDRLTYTFELQDGVKWHDGQDFDADDVIATFEMLAHPDYAGGVDRVDPIVGVEEFKANPEPGTLAGIKASEDKKTVTITINEPSATFLAGLYFQILPEHYIRDIDLTQLEQAAFNSNPVGTGPFKFKEWKVGNSITVEKNDAYYKGSPKVSSIIVKFGDNVALTTQLQTGEIDMLEVEEEGYNTFNGNPDFTLYTYPMLSVDYVGFLTGPGRADDTKEMRPVYSRNIRQALAYATNKEALVQGSFGVTGYVHDSIFPKGSMGDSDNDNPYDYDLDKSASLIEADGYAMNASTGIYEKDGQPLEVEIYYADSTSPQAAILKEQWRTAGVSVDLKLVDFGALIGVLLRKSDANGNLDGDPGYDPETAATDASFDAYLLGFAQESDPDEYAQYFVDDPFWNFYHYENADVQRWFAQQATTTDQSERTAILHQISEQITEDLPWFTYAGKNETIVAGNNIGGLDPDTRGYTMDAQNWFIK